MSVANHFFNPSEPEQSEGSNMRHNLGSNPRPHSNALTVSGSNHTWQKPVWCSPNSSILGTKHWRQVVWALFRPPSNGIPQSHLSRQIDSSQNRTASPQADIYYNLFTQSGIGWHLKRSESSRQTRECIRRWQSSVMASTVYSKTMSRWHSNEPVGNRHKPAQVYMW